MYIIIFLLLQDERENVDSSDAPLRVLPADDRLRHGLLHQLHRDLLPRLPRHPLRHDGGRHLHLHLRHPAPHAGRHRARQEPGRQPGLSLQVSWQIAVRRSSPRHD